MKTFKQLREDLNTKKLDVVLSKAEFIDFLQYEPSNAVHVTERRNDYIVKFVNVLEKGSR